jgi:sugar phosphate isomerase/epimerase
MKPLQIAIATRCLNRPLKAAVVLASELGAGGVQLDARAELKPSEISATGRRELLHMLDDVGLAVASLDFPIRSPLAAQERLDARLQSLKQTMDFAYHLKARTVTVKLGGLPPESDAGEMSLLLAVLDDLARHANRAGVTLALGMGGESAERMRTVLSGITSGPIGIDFDPAAIVASGRPSLEVLDVLSTLVAHVVDRDAVREGGGLANEVPLGRGDVTWDELLARLHEVDYRGWLCVNRTTGEDRPGDAGRAVQFLQSIYRG